MASMEPGPEHVSAADRALLSQAMSGNSAALSVLLENHRSMLIKYFTNQRARSLDDARDLTQDTLICAARAIATYRAECPFSGWLIGIAGNLLKNYYDRTLTKQDKLRSLDMLLEQDSAQVKQLRDNSCPYSTVDTNDFVQALLAVLKEACSEDEGNVLLLVYQQLETADIAEHLGMTEGLVRQHQLRGREKLLAFLVENMTDMLGGLDAVSSAWRQACEAADLRLRPTDEESAAWADPSGKMKAFRRAVLKMARYLPLPLAMAAILSRLVVGHE